MAPRRADPTEREPQPDPSTTGRWGKRLRSLLRLPGAFTDQWNPEPIGTITRSSGRPARDYHLSEDLVTQAIGYVDNHKVAAPEQPYFLYLAFGACHWPHHVPRALVDKYKGRYTAGWDEIRRPRFASQQALGAVPPDPELPSGNPGVPAWDDLSEEERRFCERSQEVYAGFIDHTDQQIGRLLAFLEEARATPTTR